MPDSTAVRRRNATALGRCDGNADQCARCGRVLRGWPASGCRNRVRSGRKTAAEDHREGVAER